MNSKARRSPLSAGGMASMLTEIRQAGRRLLARPGYSLGVFFTLTLGLALSVGMYTVLNGVILKGLPYPGGERVVEVSAVNTTLHETNGGLTAAEAFALDDAAAFEHSGWYILGGETVLDGERPREILSTNVSAGFFPALGVRPQLGRWLDAQDTRAGSRAVVLSDSEWERLTNRDPAVIGMPITLVGETVTVVGVMPPEFAYPSAVTGLWRAANPDWHRARNATFAHERFLMVIGRLAAGVDGQRAVLELDALSAELRDTYRLPDDGWRMRTTSLLDVTIGDVRGVLAGVFVISLVVLGIACANVGSLLAARLAARERELAIVQALGATSGRVWRGMLFELLLLAALATVAALVVLLLGLEVFRTLSAGMLPQASEIGLDPAVLMFAAVLALLCPLLVALPFGLRLKSRMAANLQVSSKGADDAIRGALRALPIAGLGLATAAVIAGAAVAISLERLRLVDPGFRVQDMYGVQVFHRGKPDEWRRFSRAVLERMSAEPDVEGVALTTIPPLARVGNFIISVQVPGRGKPEAWQAVLQRVSADYLEIMSQPLVEGRGFLPADDEAGPKVAIVNQAFARRAFDGTDVVDRTVALPLGDGARVEHRIVGVVADARTAELREAGGPEILVPFVQAPWVGMTFLAYAPHAADDLLSRMQDAVWAVDPEEAISRVARLQDDLEAQLAQTIYFTRMLGGFAVLALLLAGVGTYSVVAFLQRRQVRSVGIHLALGAAPLDVGRRVLLQGLALGAAAGIAGSLAAIGVLRLLASQLFGVSAASPALYALGICGVLLAALLASLGPAWRAARVQPMVALRDE